MRVPKSFLPAVCVLGALAGAPAAQATTLLNETVATAQAQWRTCHERPLSGAAGVVTRPVTAPATGSITAVMRGSRGDWDVAVLDALSGGFVAGSAAPGTRELAQGFVVQGQKLIVQACLLDGDSGAPRLAVDTQASRPSATIFHPRLMRAHTRTRAQRNALSAAGFDLDEGVNRDGSIDLVVHDAEDLVALQRTGFRITTVIEDLILHDFEKAKRDARYAEETEESTLPSGRTAYRHLADYELELKEMAMKNPGLVKLITLPNKSLLGRPVIGVEIASNVNRDDGRPVFLQLGVHHAREWPAGEMPMEWAVQMVSKYGKLSRVTKIVDSIRTIVVPIVNVDGFNLSREAPVDPATTHNYGGAALGELSKPNSDTAYGVLCCTNDPGHSYKRKNCRQKDGQVPTEAECSGAQSFIGVDPNRNYGSFWGGPGAGITIEDETYRGASPFSEPEVANVRQLVSTRQIHTMITNHTFTGLVLRPPGIKAQGPPPDEEAYKALGDAMGQANGYISQKGYELYDTTGTTEDWSYYATGGFGFTFEIGFGEFHPEFQRGVVTEWSGDGSRKGNREAYYRAAEHTADSTHHSILAGSAPAGTRIRLHKAFQTFTSGIVGESGIPGERTSFEDVLDYTHTVGDDGKFAWHVNPSTRPLRVKEQKFVLVDPTPKKDTPIANETPTGGEPGAGGETVPFEIKADEPHEALHIQVAMGTENDDYDLYLFKIKDDGTREQVSVAGKGAGATENMVIPDPEVGKYELDVNNFAAAGGWHGFIRMLGAKERRTDPAAKETYTLTCERPDGTVFATREVFVERGQRLDLGVKTCTNAGKAGAGAGQLKLRMRFAGARTLRRGVGVRATCSLRCTLRLSLALGRADAKRLGLGRVVGRSKAVTFKGTKTLRVRFARKAAARLRGRRVRVNLIGTATASNRRRETASLRFALRR